MPPYHGAAGMHGYHGLPHHGTAMHYPPYGVHPSMLPPSGMHVMGPHGMPVAMAGQPGSAMATPVTAAPGGMVASGAVYGAGVQGFPSSIPPSPPTGVAPGFGMPQASAAPAMATVDGVAGSAAPSGTGVGIGAGAVEAGVGGGGGVGGAPAVSDAQGGGGDGGAGVRQPTVPADSPLVRMPQLPVDAPPLQDLPASAVPPQ